MSKNEKKVVYKEESENRIRPSPRKSEYASFELTEERTESSEKVGRQSGTASSPLKIVSPKSVAPLAIDDSLLNEGSEHPSTQQTEQLKLNPQKEKIVVGSSQNLSPLTDIEALETLEKTIVYVGEENELYATYSTEEAAEQLSVDISTIINLIESRRLVGFVEESGEWRIPKIQIRNGQVAPALDKVAGYFDDSLHLWHYIVRKQLLGEERVRPLELHFQNEIDFAVGLAAGYGTDFM